jgi:hypothetical protein
MVNAAINLPVTGNFFPLRRQKNRTLYIRARVEGCFSVFFQKNRIAP